MQVFFVILVGLVFFLEGIGLQYGREAAFSLILIIPLSLFLLDVIRGKKIFMPGKMTTLFGLFVFFSAISVVFSVNVQRSFEYLLYCISTFLIFLYAYNHKDLIKIVPVFVFAASAVFALYSAFINHFLPAGWEFLIPDRGFQYVFAYFKTHNPLGALLLIPVIMSFSYFVIGKKTGHLLLFLIMLPFFLLTYSRSAYLAFIEAGLILMAYQVMQKKVSLFSAKTLIAALTIGLCLSFFFLTVSYKSAPAFIKTANGILQKRMGLNNKTFLSNRNLYFRSALISIRERPFFGVGPNNFVYASALHATNTGAISWTADNIFLEVFSENGLLAGIIFVLVIAMIFVKADKKHLSLFITLVSMFLLFQTDSSQRNYSYLLLFFILAGLLYKEGPVAGGGRLVFPLAIFLFTVAMSMFMSVLFYDGRNYKIAFYLYPFSQQALESHLTAMPPGKNGQFLRLYARLYSGDPRALSIIANNYLKTGDRETAHVYLKRFSRYYPYSASNLDVFYQAYHLERDLSGKEKADALANAYFKRIEDANREAGLEPDYRKRAKYLCAIIYNVCPFGL
ncbi:MAG: O-antigen ligase family protein [Patescibacteria group bacterium]